MKFSLYAAAGILCGSFVCVYGSFAQQTPSSTSSQPQVLFSGPQKTAPAEAAAPAAATKVTDAERSAVTFTAYDLNVHLTPHAQSLEVHARVTVRNDGNAALKEIPLQLSSTLHFEAIGVGGKRVEFTQAMVNSDVDHSGQLREAAVPLEEALAPKASLTLDVDYGGEIPVNAMRLTAIGTPGVAAEASDWDRISDEFTGLRGFGNVVWYPVSSVPAMFGDGDKVFGEIGRQKLRSEDATVALHITEEFFSEPPNVAVLDGHFVAMDKPVAMPSATFPGVVTCSLPKGRLGFRAPSIFLAQRVASQNAHLRIYARDADQTDAQGYETAETMVEPLVQQWLGAKPEAMLTVIDLPEADDAPAETGDLLLTPLAATAPENVAPAIAHGLTHAFFHSPYEWLNEGVASFVDALWIESTQGQTTALERLNAERPALTLAEPGTPGEGSGEDLLHASDAIYYRTKAAYVLWMLRDAAGEKPLQAALSAYDPAKDTHPEYFEQLLEQQSGKDLKWFFDDWVYHDRGLPDLSIAGVYPGVSAHGQTLLAIDLANDGYAAVEVPLTVTAGGSSVTERVQIPGHTKITHRMLVTGPATEIDLNDGSVPEVQDSVHKKILTNVPTGE
jgi:hypothetical protein